MRKKLLAMMCMSLFLVAGFSAFAQTTSTNNTIVGDSIVTPTFPTIEITGGDAGVSVRYQRTVAGYDIYEITKWASVNWIVSGGKESAYPFTARVSISALPIPRDIPPIERTVTGPGSYTTTISGTEFTMVPEGWIPNSQPVTLLSASIIGVKNSVMFTWTSYIWPIDIRPCSGPALTYEENAAWYTGRAAYETYTLPDDAFDKNPEQRRNALMQKYLEVFEKINDQEYQGAINKLENDIRAKMDGSVDGNPNNDWVIDAEAQGKLCTLIDVATGNLGEI